ncbi:MAG: acyl-CoA thioesterase [SAR324 cluster bacterium]|nr:acyl-CoA thioesterase [SAR324 cluster bacterium]
MKKPASKTPEDTRSYIAEVIGEESLVGARMPAGELLHLMDLAAVTAAWKFCQSEAVTIAFDRVELLNYICHMDYFRYEACVIKTGMSSMIIQVDGYNKAPTEMELHPAHSGIITMVAINEDGTPNRNIPELEYHSKADLEKKELIRNREKALIKRKKALANIEASPAILTDHFPDPCERSAYYAPSDTELTFRKIFMPKNTNPLGVVFGGDIIQLMEDLAIANARTFTGNLNMVTIAMEDVTFLRPIKSKDLVSMISRVTFVAQTTMVVEVITEILHPFSDERYVTHKGTFTVLNYDRAGRKKMITTGLDMSQASLEEKKQNLKELIKYTIRNNN